MIYNGRIVPAAIDFFLPQLGYCNFKFCPCYIFRRKWIFVNLGKRSIRYLKAPLLVRACSSCPTVRSRQNTGIQSPKNITFSDYDNKKSLSFADIRKSEVLDKLVQALALQTSSEVNYSELALIVNIDKNTVSKYIDILQKGYIIFKLSSFSRNVRNEIKTNKKIYFYDNGIRNMVIENFNPIELRTDKGAL